MQRPITQYSPIIGCSNWLSKIITNTQWIYHSRLSEAPMVMEAHRFAFITMGCRYTWQVLKIIQQHKSTTELKFHFQTKNGIKTTIPLPKLNGPTPIQQYKHCIFKWLSSSRHAWSNTNPQACWAFIYIYSAWYYSFWMLLNTTRNVEYYSINIIQYYSILLNINNIAENYQYYLILPILFNITCWSDPGYFSGWYYFEYQSEVICNSITYLQVLTRAARHVLVWNSMLYKRVSLCQWFWKIRKTWTRVHHVI